MVKIAINGFGRIGRAVFRAISMHYPNVEIAAVNTSGSMDINGLAHLLRYDTAYGQYAKDVVTEASTTAPEIGKLTIEGKSVPFLAIREPDQIPWSTYGIDVVIESTGLFRDKEKAGKHLVGGAKKVIVSAPPKGEEIPIYILSVNETTYHGETVISNGSCTTNCVAPVAKIILEAFGIEQMAMTTIHAYTSSQLLVDNSHKDLRRARAAASNIIPTSTGAAKAVVSAIPALAGKFTAMALRIPILVGSFSDFTFRLSRTVTKEEVQQLFVEKANHEYKGIVFASNEPLVSSDIVGNSHSAIVDLELTDVLGGNLLKVAAWYDNEWGYACRIIELASYITS